MRLDRTVQPSLDPRLQSSAITYLQSHLGDCGLAEADIRSDLLACLESAARVIYLAGTPPMLGTSAFPEKHSVLFSCRLLKVSPHLSGPHLCTELFNAILTYRRGVQQRFSSKKEK